jgi:hypothetical protein
LISISSSPEMILRHKILNLSYRRILPKQDFIIMGGICGKTANQDYLLDETNHGTGWGVPPPPRKQDDAPLSGASSQDATVKVGDVDTEAATQPARKFSGMCHRRLLTRSSRTNIIISSPEKKRWKLQSNRCGSSTRRNRQGNEKRRV